MDVPNDRRRRRTGALLALLVALVAAACGGKMPELPPDSVRGVVPVLAAGELQPVTTVLEHLDFPKLRAGEQYECRFETRPGRSYVVRQWFSYEADAAAPREFPVTGTGPAPTIFGGRADDPDPPRLRALAGGRHASRIEVHFVAPTEDSRVVVRVPGPPGLLWSMGGLEVVERPEPNDTGPRRPMGDAVKAWSLFHDQRPGIAVPRERPLSIPVDVPAHATALEFAVTHRGATDRHALGTRGLLDLTLTATEGGGELSLHGLAVSGGSVWDERVVEVPPGLRGRAATLTLANPGETSAEDVIVSVPTFLCTQGRRRPNLVLVCLDTTRRDHFGLYGYERDTTPRIDEFAKDAVVFADAIATAPYTLPSHASMFSGQYPSFHRAQHPAHAIDVDDTPMLAAILAERGWATRAFTGGGYLSSDYGFAHGFSAFTNLDPVQDLESMRRAAEAGDLNARAVLELHATHGWDAALDWLDGHRDVPFFLFLQTFAVHDYRPPPSHRGRWRSAEARPAAPLRRIEDQRGDPYSAAEQRHLIDLYDAGLRWVDEHVGQLFDRLESAGLADDTIVVITSDHGEEFGERGFNGHNLSVHGEQVDVPLVIRVPGARPRRVLERVSLVDLAPTLLDLLEVPVPVEMQGRSLRPSWDPTVTGDGEAWRPSPVIAEVDSNVTRSLSYYSGRHKLITSDVDAQVTLPATEAAQLYDLGEDPRESTNLFESDRDTAESLWVEYARIQVDLLDRFFGDTDEPEDGARPVELSEETRRQLIELGYLEDG